MLIGGNGQVNKIVVFSSSLQAGENALNESALEFLDSNHLRRSGQAKGLAQWATKISMSRDIDTWGGAWIIPVV